MTLRLLSAILLMGFLGNPALADDALLALGKTLAEKNCATCHAVAVSGNSPLRDVAPFRDIAISYKDGELEKAFNAGTISDHPLMQGWRMNPQESAALAAYIMSLAPHGIKKTELSQ
jgi:cytochrome c